MSDDVPLCPWCNVVLTAVDCGVAVCPACREVFFVEADR